MYMYAVLTWFSVLRISHSLCQTSPAHEARYSILVDAHRHSDMIIVDTTVYCTVYYVFTASPSVTSQIKYTITIQSTSTSYRRYSIFTRSSWSPKTQLCQRREFSRMEMDAWTMFFLLFISRVVHHRVV